MHDMQALNPLQYASAVLERLNIYVSKLICLKHNSRALPKAYNTIFLTIATTPAIERHFVAVLQELQLRVILQGLCFILHPVCFEETA